MEKSTLDAGGMIPPKEAAAMTKAFREKYTPEFPMSMMMGKGTLVRLLNTKGAAGVRFYNGIDPTTGKQTLVAVAVDGQGNDILPKEDHAPAAFSNDKYMEKVASAQSLAALGTEDPEIADKSVVCPPACSDDNYLNS